MTYAASPGSGPGSPKSPNRWTSLMPMPWASEAGTGWSTPRCEMFPIRGAAPTRSAMNWMDCSCPRPRPPARSAQRP